MIKKVLISLVVTLISLNSYALSVSGIAEQGGLLLIKFDYSITKNIYINKKKLQLTSDGLEYYPVNRNAKKLTIKQELKNGTISKKIVKVKQREYQVQSIKGIKKSYVTPNKKLVARISKESKEIKQSRRFNSLRFFKTELPEFKLPVEGKVTGVFGSRRLYNGKERSWHKGLDIANKEKTPIYAPLRGRVVLAMKDSFYNGNLVIIDHGKKIYTIFAHMYDILVKKGDMVGPNDMIGSVGSTGRSTGPHLHWGVYVSQQAVDPKLLLKKGR